MASRRTDQLQPKKTSRALPMALLRGREIIMSRFRPMLALHDVSEQQWRVLRVLNEVRFLDASEVANRATILAPSLTRIIKTLEGRGLIQSGKFDKDGRRVLLSITPAGTELIQKILPQSLEIYKEIDARFGSDKIEQLLNLLEDLEKISEDAPVQTPEAAAAK
ncbi:homoprotocatechuate degradation regulator HpaR [Ochrobactrum intermedium]|uniref:Homoprotocatechuate degradation regulator HpaR n=1 Tax=Brucella intermedia TaxID=94625 RepID=A0ABR6AVK5_9HYPH|nr:homoprotocatechuate degradation operon regulator HpaR [Brucella intermedia]MBA8853471.1 homoprotocatechuate degradation regulator HpaR [Brucella intermedia]